MEPGDVWTRFAHDPRRPDHAHLRASDRDRDLVRDVLGDALVDGRLSVEEHGERIDRTGLARTLGELPVLIRDLVPDRPVQRSRLARMDTEQIRAEAERRYRSERRGAAQSAVVVSLACTAIWAATGLGFFWPVFVVLALVGRFGFVVVNRDARVAEISHRLERRRSRAALFHDLRSLPPGRRPR